MSQQRPQQQNPSSPGRPGPASRADAETRRDVDAALAARAELGPEYDEHIAAGLAERVEQLAAIRTAELRHAADVGGHADAAERTSHKQRFVLGIVSLGAGIPITAISGALVEPSLIGVLISWTGIVGVNVAAGLGHRRR